jgi:hypothetical protein
LIVREIGVFLSIFFELSCWEDDLGLLKEEFNLSFDLWQDEVLRLVETVQDSMWLDLKHVLNVQSLKQ